MRSRFLAATAAGLIALTLAAPASAQSPVRPTSALDDARAAYNEARAAADEAAADHEEAVSAFYALKNEIDALETDIETAEASAELLRADARRIARDAYTGGRVDFVETLDSDDVLDAARKTQLYDRLKAGDDDKLDELRRVNDDLSTRRESLDAARAEQAEVMAELDDEAAALDAQLAESQARLAELEEQRRIEEERAAAAAAAAAAEQAAAEQAAADQVARNAVPSTAPPSTSAPQPAPSSPPPTGSGGTPGGAFNLVCPVPGSSFTDSWGAPRSTGGHQAVDMLAPIGTPNYAVVSGTASPRSMGIGGYGVSLSGDDGNLYYYIHLKPGTGVSGRVSQGQFIGSGGDSGNAAGTPHTHFEIHPGHGPAINPYPHVRPIC